MKQEQDAIKKIENQNNSWKLKYERKKKIQYKGQKLPLRKSPENKTKTRDRR